MGVADDDSTRADFPLAKTLDEVETMNTNATETWQTCMIALDCGDSAGASGLDDALTNDRALDGVKYEVGLGVHILRHELTMYANVMLDALRLRAKGDIKRSLACEDHANRIYRKIPKTWRW